MLGAATGAAGRTADLMRRHGFVLLLVSYAVILLGYAVANPPGMAPDEPAHYYKAVALAQGDARGLPAAYARMYRVPPSEMPWLNRTSRALRVPDKLTGCDPLFLKLDNRCPRTGTATRPRLPVPAGHMVSYVATYPPYLYVVPAAGIKLAQGLGFGAYRALLLARLASAALCLVLLGGAAACLLRDGQEATGLVGLSLSLTPMVLFIGAQLGGSGFEIAGAICLLAAALRLTAPDEQVAPTVAWWALAGGGLVCSLSRSTGPFWVLGLLALVALLRGPRAVLRILRRHRAATPLTALALAAGMVATGVWSAVVEPHATAHTAAVAHGLLHALAQLPDVLKQAVGVTGWIDVYPPLVVPLLWLGLVAAQLGLAFRVGTGRERLTLGAAAAGAVASTLLVSAVVIQPTGQQFRMQGRYVLPVLVALPLLSAEVLAAHRRRVRAVMPSSGGASPLVIVTVTLLLQAVMFCVNGSFYATGGMAPGLFSRYGVPGWQPPGSWAAWDVLVTLCASVGLWGAWRTLLDAGASRTTLDPATSVRPAAATEAVASGARVSS